MERSKVKISVAKAVFMERKIDTTIKPIPIEFIKAKGKLISPIVLFLTYKYGFISFVVLVVH